jgi:hypothetical protein
VFLISIREPVVSWAGEMWPFPSKPRAVLREISERMSSGVTPHAAHDEDGNPRRGWRCLSLMKALYLMLYLDGTEDVEIRG